MGCGSAGRYGAFSMSNQVSPAVVSGDSPAAERGGVPALAPPDLFATWLRLQSMYDEAIEDVRERIRSLEQARAKAEGLSRQIRLLMEDGNARIR